MTTEIEKELFEKYGVEAVFNRFDVEYKVKGSNTILGGGTSYIDNEKTANDVKCRLVKLYKEKYNQNIKITKLEPYYTYPPITAKKVLRLIEFVNRHCILCFEDFMFTKKITAHIIKDVGDNYPTITSQECDLTQTLCKLTTLLFDHLTPQERNEVKEVLEK